MKKTNSIILTLILCFSLVFVVYPLRTLADGDLTYGAPGVTIGSLGGGLTVIPTVSLGTVGESPEAWTIDWTGQSETTFGADPALGGYIYTPPPPTKPPTTSGDGDGGDHEEKTYPYKACVSGGCKEGTCAYFQSTDPNRPDECQTDAECGNGGTPPPVSPPPVSPPPVSPPPVSPPPVSPPPTSPPPTSPPPTCQIFEFSINGRTNEDQDPLIVWVNAVLRGYFSVNDVCTSCKVTSVPSDGNDNWTGTKGTYDPLSSTYVTEQFKINTAGNYTYTLGCIGDPDNPDDFDEDILSLKTVQAINLPWWREIIPVLPGFLRGIWR